MPTEDKTDQEKRARGRNFPTVSLSKALDIAKTLYTHSRRSSIPREAAAKHLGYTNARSGSANVALALPAYYGLLEEAGTGKVRVSASTEGIMHPKNSSERYELLKEASMRPKAFKEIIDRYKITDLQSVPSDATLKPILIREWQLPEAMALKFLKSFRETMMFVQSEAPSAGSVPHKEEEQDRHPAETADDAEKRDGQSTRKTSNPGKDDEKTGEHLASPLSERTRVDLRITGPLGTKEIARLQKWVHGVLMPWASYLQEDSSPLEDEEET